MVHSGWTLQLVGDFVFQIHSIKLQNEIWKCNSYICIVHQSPWFIHFAISCCMFFYCRTYTVHHASVMIMLLCQHLDVAPEEGEYTRDKLSDPTYTPSLRFQLVLRLQNGGCVCGTLPYMVPMRLWCQRYIHNNIYQAALEQGKMNSAGELDNSKATNTQAKYVVYNSYLNRRMYPRIPYVTTFFGLKDSCILVILYLCR